MCVTVTAGMLVNDTLGELDTAPLAAAPKVTSNVTSELGGTLGEAAASDVTLVLTLLLAALAALL